MNTVIFSYIPVLYNFTYNETAYGSMKKCNAGTIDANKHVMRVMRALLLHVKYSITM